ncbi:hypothetical protein G6700_01720 [Polynucleobacter paneuropaeus]|nr:hypothetical protein G6700_01720 [Polynucleobacter paneuropaeus]
MGQYAIPDLSDSIKMINLTSQREKINRLIEQNLPQTNVVREIFSSINSLDSKAVGALYRALDFEFNNSEYSREEHLNDLYIFDNNLKNIFSAILGAQLDISPLINDVSPSLFDRNKLLENQRLKELLEMGYVLSPYKLRDEKISEIYRGIQDLKFINRGIYHQEFLGKEIISNLPSEKKLRKLLGKNGDTLWIKDQNDLVGRDIFQKIAFDPYLVSMASRYLGCCPVHVQTNIWFSFPTYGSTANKSLNGQLFHQDKEFIKFLKVFIYLTDVNENNGAHCYVESSHADEAHEYGLKLSDRFSDEQVIQVYGAHRIKKLMGSAGTIAFGDTSSMHKGLPIVSGHRAILQIEYASSLYLSPVLYFSNFQSLRSDSFSKVFWSRLTKNYCDKKKLVKKINQNPTPSMAVWHLKSFLKLMIRNLSFFKHPK